MSGVALAAGLHAAFTPAATEETQALDGAKPDTFALDNRGLRARSATVDLAGRVLPVPRIRDPLTPGPMLAGSNRETLQFAHAHGTAPLTTAGDTVSITSPAVEPAMADLATASEAGNDDAGSLSMADDLGLAQPTLPQVSAAAGLEANVEAEHVVVKRGDTLLQILIRSGINRAEAHLVVGTLSTVYDPRQLRVGQAMEVEVEHAGDRLAAPRLAALSLNLDFGNDLRVERDANGEFAARTVDRELVETVHAAHAVIDGTLYKTARRQDVPDEALVNLANIFSWDVDFQRDVHPGDSFELVYQQVESPDGEVRGGEVLFASLRLRGRNLHAYRYEHADGSHGYYDANGRSLRKWLMRTPIDGARLSSGFGPRRHPILGYNRMHRGVDFAAPTGTPIYAAGDGVLVMAGRNGGYGNYIEIRHNSEFSTAYAHLSRFAKGIERGNRVRQGQVIGYVGSTGRSTGPHLHYEVKQNGKQINPMSIKPQTAVRLAGAELERFHRQIETIEASRPTSTGRTTLAQR
jgi:murein DD-endopeptidase MepM/ murein hydrolase activator NlpD